MSERILIGESEMAGMAISAPLTLDKDIPYGCEVRWIQREDSFSLQYLDNELRWRDVPVVKEEK